MADGGVEGLGELLSRFSNLPRRLKQSVLRGWATAQSKRMAARLRPYVRARAFKTGRLTGSIIGKAVRSPRSLSVFKAIARAIAYSSRRNGGYAFNPINAGTKDRYTKGGISRNKTSGRYQVANASTKIFGKRAYRGRVVARNIISQAAPNVHAAVTPGAAEDLGRRIERALSKAGAV